MALDDATAASWASSMLGIDYELKRTANLQEALATPGAYYAKRGERLTAISRDINTAFANKFRELKAQGLPKEDAQRRAEAWASALYKLKVEELDFDYPASIQQLGANLMYKSGAARTGIDYTDAQGSSKARTSKPKRK